jgi:hypothetical protein
MVDREAQYVAREHEDYLLGSIDDLRKRLEKLRIAWRQTDEAAESLICLHGEREGLAYRCLIARDWYHILELYCTCMRAALPKAPADLPKSPAACPRQEISEGKRMLPFSEWLFEGKM